MLHHWSPVGLTKDHSLGSTQDVDTVSTLDRAPMAWAPEPNHSLSGIPKWVPGPALHKTLEPCGPHQGSFPREHTGCGHCVNPGQSTNGMDPRAEPQSLRNPQVGSWASPAQGMHRALPFLEVRDSRSQDGVLPSLEETPAMGKEECRAPAEAQSPVWEGQDHVLPLPAQSYPPQWDLATDKHGEVEEEDEAVAKAFPLLEVATVGEDVDKAEQQEESVWLSEPV
ncbi:hypothetical protein H920_05710 [Fukomys damarensis]|uniref:Uncharacterized protein n=1 Tax=Fukomys damarensis TaxID=885580 RepID=A0A091EC23_FUKDA|nr:hypothetical protein H920_05710 [Fukomys damarensis]